MHSGKKYSNALCKVGDEVTFCIDGALKKGVVFVVDKNGTFERPGISSYDIDVESENTLYKHIPCDFVISEDINESGMGNSKH